MKNCCAIQKAVLCKRIINYDSLDSKPRSDRVYPFAKIANSISLSETKAPLFSRDALSTLMSLVSRLKSSTLQSTAKLHIKRSLSTTHLSPSFNRAAFQTLKSLETFKLKAISGISDRHRYLYLKICWKFKSFESLNIRKTLEKDALYRRVRNWAIEFWMSLIIESIILIHNLLIWILKLRKKKGKLARYRVDRLARVSQAVIQ